MRDDDGGGFDRLHGTDTEGIVPPELLGHDHDVLEQCLQYEPTEPALFRRMLQELPIDHSDYTFVDLGSGKGRALLLAAEYPFGRVVGVEASPLLHATAQLNLTVYRSGARRCRCIDLLRGDAANFELPTGPLIVYLFNPFGARRIAKVLRNIKNALELQPRDLWVIYYYPEHRYLFQRCRCLARVGTVGGREDEPYDLFRSR